MTEILLVVHLLVALALIGSVLLQRSEGGALGIGGGGGGGGSMFSSRGVGNALTRTTAILALAFFATSITLTILARGTSNPSSALDTVKPAASGSSESGEAAPKSVLPKLPGSETPTTPQVPVE